MSMVRLRRLTADHERVQHYVTHHPRLQLIQAEGNPPERYQIEYRIHSLRQKDGELHTVSSHLVEISLPRDYPRVPPLCRMLTPVFHPNIAPHAICIGDHWSAGESLHSLIARIGEILAYQSYNTRSPLNGEAARWTDQNIAKLPLDSVSMTLEESGTAPAAHHGAPPHPAPVSVPVAPRPMPLPPPIRSHAAVASSPAPAAAQAAAESTIVTCPTCGVRLRLRAMPTEHARCPKCRSAFKVPRPQAV